MRFSVNFCIAIGDRWYYTVEPLNNGHLETQTLSYNTEVVPSLFEVKNALESDHLGPQSVFFIDKFFFCVLYRN